MNEIKNINACLDFRRRGSVGSHILRNNNLAQDTLNGSGMSSGIDSTGSLHNNLFEEMIDHRSYLHNLSSCKIKA